MSRFAAERPGHGRIPPDTPLEAPKDWPDDLPTLTSAQWNHIIYGEYVKKSHRPYQGGHMYGYGWWDAPKSTEFPANWTPDDILDAIKAVLRNPEKENGIGIYKGVRIRVITGPQKNGTEAVITAYSIPSKE